MDCDVLVHVERSRLDATEAKVVLVILFVDIWLCAVELNRGRLTFSHDDNDEFDCMCKTYLASGGAD